MATAAEYEARAVDRIREILSTEHAVVRREIEARISEGYFQSSRQNIDPHHVSNALRFLTDQREEFEWVSAPTRGKGKQPIATLQPVNRTGRSTKIEKAAARKRLLYGRYMGWASGTQRFPHGLIGPAGEAAMRAGITQSEVVIPLASDAGAVANVLGVAVPGPLDSAGFIVPLDDNGLPGAPVTALFEVKTCASGSIRAPPSHTNSWAKRSLSNRPGQTPKCCRYSCAGERIERSSGWPLNLASWSSRWTANS